MGPEMAAWRPCCPLLIFEVNDVERAGGEEAGGAVWVGG